MNEPLTPDEQIEPQDLTAIDQTGFSTQEPMFEQPPVVTDPTQMNQAPVIKKPWFRQPKILVAILVSVLVVLTILTLIAMTLRRPMTFLPSSAFSHPSPSPVLTPEQQKVNDLKAELQAADPTKQELTYPPVMSDLSVPQLTQPGP